MRGWLTLVAFGFIVALASGQPEPGRNSGSGKLPMLPAKEKELPPPGSTAPKTTPIPDGYHEMNFKRVSYDMQSRQLVVDGAAPSGWKVEIGQTIKGESLVAHIYAKIPHKWTEEPTPFRLVLNLAASERVKTIDVIGREMAYKIDITSRSGSLADE